MFISMYTNISLLELQLQTVLVIEGLMQQLSYLKWYAFVSNFNLDIFIRYGMI